MTNAKHPRSKRMSLRKKLAGLARVGLYVALCSLVLGLWTARQVKAAIGKKMLALGNETMSQGVIDADVNKIRLNGEEFSIALVAFDKPLASVLDDFQGACDKGQSAFRELWKTIDAAGPQAAGADLATGANSLRFDEEGSGVVLCFLEKANAPRRTLLETFEAAAASGELGEFGALRYVHARESEGKTQVMALWSDSSLDLSKLAGDESGDVPGLDPVNIARPADARRTFSASMPNTPYNYNLYLSSQRADVILGTYDRALVKAGWTEVSSPTPPDDRSKRIYVKPMIMVVVLATDTEEGTVVSVIESSRRERLDVPAPAARINDG